FQEFKSNVELMMVGGVVSKLFVSRCAYYIGSSVSDEELPVLLRAWGYTGPISREALINPIKAYLVGLSANAASTTIVQLMQGVRDLKQIGKTTLYMTLQQVGMDAAVGL